MKKRISAVLLAAMLAVSTAACGGGGNGGGSSDGNSNGGGGDTIVIGTEQWNGVFTPIYANNLQDQKISEAVIETILEANVNNELIDNLGSIEEKTFEENGEKKTLYTIKLSDGVKFSDGEALTIDDVIFSYKVLADPNYDGTATFRTAVNIEGMNEYYYDNPDYSASVKKIETESQKAAKDKDQFIQYLVESKCDGMYVAIDEDPDGEDGPLTSWADYINQNGGKIAEADAKDEAKVLQALAEVEYAKNQANYDAATYYYEKMSKELVSEGLSDGIDVPEIIGIKKVDDLSCEITVDGVDMNARRQLGSVGIVPEHYYGKGYEKGKLDGVKALNEKPLGTGAYKFVSNKDNVVTMEANEDYRLGAPKTKYLKFQVIETQQKPDAIINGDIDITDPSASQETVGQMDDAGIEYKLVDNNGYGYIAVSAKRIPDKNVREGLMHLMTREQAVSTYYGKVAEVLERPMSSVFAEYPKDAKEYWGYDTEKALECFKKAGYEQKDGKLVKDGKQLIVEVAIGDAKSHPATPIFTQMKNDMEAMGAKLNISDTDLSILINRTQNDDVDMWCMAWSNATDCDLTQMFGSEYTKAGGSNRTWIKDKELDKLLAQVRETLDLEKRKELVAQELDLIMSWATYMPVYQRKNMWAFSSNVNMDSIPKEFSTFYTFYNELEKLELN